MIDTSEKKKRGRPKGWKKTTELKHLVDNSVTVASIPEENFVRGAYPTLSNSSDVQQQVAAVIKEIFVEKIVEIPAPRLEGFELYKALKDKGYPQGGMGQTMEDPNGIERVYIPHPNEVQAFFIENPDKMEAMRDAIIRAYIELR